MRRRFLIIHNPKAGLKGASLLGQTLLALEAVGAELQFEVANDVEDDARIAAEAAAEGAVDAVVAAGGDSTVRGVAKGLIGTNMPLGVIPVGTGNVLAAEIGLKRRPDMVATALCEGPVKQLTIGRANGEPFLLMAGVGFDAEVVRHLDHGLKQRIKKGAYVWPSLRALLGRRPPRLDVEIAGSHCSAGFVVVSRVQHYGGSFMLAPKADPTAPDSQVVVFDARSRLRLMRQLLDLARGRIANARKVACLPARDVIITAPEPAPTQIDGDWFGTTPLHVTVTDEKVGLILPLARA